MNGLLRFGAAMRKRARYRNPYRACKTFDWPEDRDVSLAELRASSRARGGYQVVRLSPKRFAEAPTIWAAVTRREMPVASIWLPGGYAVVEMTQLVWSTSPTDVST